LREALLIGVLLSINNIGMGIGAGITGMPIFITPFICGVASFIFVKSGSLLGNLFHTGKLSKIMEVLSAVFVLILGILGFFN
jgi:putative Mn2+ efflux pump MntP